MSIPTTSQKTSKLLKEAGFPQDTYFYHNFYYTNGKLLSRVEAFKCHSYRVQGYKANKENQPCAAPTTDELFEKLPARLRLPKGDFWLHMFPLKEHRAWDCRYRGYEDKNNYETMFHNEQEKTLPEALAKMYLQLKSQGLLTKEGEG